MMGPLGPRWAHLNPSAPGRVQPGPFIPKAVCGPQLSFPSTCEPGHCPSPRFPDEATCGEGRLHQPKKTGPQPLPPTCCVTLMERVTSLSLL